MTRTPVVLALAAGFALVVHAAQAPPNLSGTWRPQNPTGPQNIPFEFTIAQTADSVTIRTPLGNPESVTLKLDGTEMRGQSAGPGPGTWTLSSRAVWEGSKLAVTTSLTSGQAFSRTKQVYSLDGDKLTLEMSNPGPEGAPSSPPRTATYVKYVPVPLSAPPTRAAEPGYVSLFNGKDLTGWKVGGSPDAFKAENGTIVANGVGGAAHLFYDGTVGNHAFQDFDLKLDAVARYRSNGGVYIMTQFVPQGFPPNGFEVQVNNSHTDRIRTASLYHVVDLSYIPAKDDEWMPMQIVSRANTITISVKGQEVVRWTQPADWPGSYDFPNRRIAPGTIAFQAHDPYSVTAYSNIRIKIN